MRAKAPAIDEASRAAAEGAAVLEEVHLVRDPVTGRSRIEVVYTAGGQRCRAAASGTPRGDGHMLAEVVKRDRPAPGLFASGPVFHISPDYLWRVFVDLESSRTARRVSSGTRSAVSVRRRRETGRVLARLARARPNTPVYLNGRPATVVHSEQGVDPTGQPAVWVVVDVPDDFDTVAMLTGQPTPPAAPKEPDMTNPFGGLFDNLNAVLGAATEKAGTTMAAQFAVAAALDNNDAGVRQQLAGLTADQRAQIRRAAKTLARAVKVMDGAGE